MGKKKGGKKSKLTDEEIAAIEAHNKKYRDLDVELRSLSTPRWARLHLICAMDKGTPLIQCNIDVPIAETRLANIYDYIVGRHGNSISQVTMYKDKKRDINELAPLSAYLCDVGFEGVPEGETSTYPVYDVMYDFKPASTRCHLLLSNPHSTYDHAAEMDTASPKR